MPLILLEPQRWGKPTWSISGQTESIVSDAELPERNSVMMIYSTTDFPSSPHIYF